MKRDKLSDCELGDWVDHRIYLNDRDFIGFYQRSIDDFDMDKNNMVHVLEPVEWDFVKAWVCVRKGRPDHGCYGNEVHKESQA